MSTSEARLRLASAIERMAAASLAIEAKLTDEAVLAFITAAQEASKAHAELMVAALARARKAAKR